MFEYRLTIGARALHLPEKPRPTITVKMTVLVGSRHEGYGETGMAHLLEHMVSSDGPNLPTPYSNLGYDYGKPNASCPA
jgi:zinc protease